ncbi:DUF2868 domain-containing protein [Salinisphaera sp. T31B1]|uniref:DUF2868 domain-containing protein n=1 Tax=Salinisphaera sp. T31B1 TaxID=727963 RepID=UPI00333FFE6B
MNAVRRTPVGWTLADLIDFEALLAGMSEDDIAGDRLYFARDIRPQLGAGSEIARRRRGLRLWLAMRAQHTPPVPGRLWRRGRSVAELGLSLGMALAGFILVAGLCAGVSQSVHVIVFFALTLIVPWAVFVLWAIVRIAGQGSGQALERLLDLGLRLGAGVTGAEPDGVAADWRERLLEGRQPRRALAAALGGTLQRGGLGFSVGLVAAFIGCLMIFDVRFYWEATPETGGLMQSSVQAIATPWQWAWPAAVPSTAAIESSRARFVDGVKRVPDTPASAGAWWRFLLMSLLVWGVLPRLLLIGYFGWREHRALARLDFQAPRHRALWRGLTAVERGAVAAAAADGALVLDVGGNGVSGDELRGFCLRALRLNPQAVHRIDVLDEAEQAAADSALADAPAHVLLAVADWSLSPRQAAALQARVRNAAGADTPVTWVVIGQGEGRWSAPADEHMARWTRFVDGLRDPATEVAAFDPGA